MVRTNCLLAQFYGKLYFSLCLEKSALWVPPSSLSLEDKPLEICGAGESHRFTAACTHGNGQRASKLWATHHP